MRRKGRGKIKEPNGDREREEKNNEGEVKKNIFAKSV